MKILNLTQHNATEEQRAAGVIEPADKKAVQELLTFNDLPSHYEVWSRAEKLAKIAEAEGVTEAMIGGAPFLMYPLEMALRNRGVQPLFAFSRRETVEKPLPDGGVQKVAVFRHLGFYES